MFTDTLMTVSVNIADIATWT